MGATSIATVCQIGFHPVSLHVFYSNIAFLLLTHITAEKHFLVQQELNDAQV